MFEKKMYSYKVYSNEMVKFLGILGSLGLTFSISEEHLEKSMRFGERHYRFVDVRAYDWEYKKLFKKIHIVR